MNVLVIPEDFRKDQFILQPILSAMFTRLGRPSIVEILKDPLVGGVNRAMNRELLEEIVKMNRWKVDLFLLCVDRDGDPNRRTALDRLEAHFRGFLGGSKFLMAENAWQELEVWVLAGHELPSGWRWNEIREERDPKEKYFDRLVEQRGLRNDPGAGRKTLGLEAARKYNRLRSRCREDIQVLEERLERWMMDGEFPSWSEARSRF